MAFINERDYRLAEEIVACLPAESIEDPGARAVLVRLVNLALRQQEQFVSLRRELPRDVDRARHALTVLERAARRAAKVLPPTGRTICEGMAQDATRMKGLWTKPIRRSFRPLARIAAVLRRKVTHDQATALMVEVRRAVRVIDGIVGTDQALQAYRNAPLD